MSTCERHTEHAIRGGEGLVGRSFPDMNRFPDGYWDPCDAEMGTYVYCGSHLRPHRTGWCSVGTNNKIPLAATEREEAYAEVRAMGLRIFGEDGVGDA